MSKLGNGVLSAAVCKHQKVPMSKGMCHWYRTLTTRLINYEQGTEAVAYTLRGTSKKLENR